MVAVEQKFPALLRANGVTPGGSPGGSGTVTSVSVTTANGVSGTVATATTTPAITLTLGAITPTTVNGNTITTGTGTLTLGAGKTLTANNNITISGTDGEALVLTKGLTITTNAGTIAFSGASKTLTVPLDASVSGTNTGDQTSVSGNAGTVTTADAGGDTSTWVLLGNAQTGSQAPATDAGLTYDANANALTTTTFIGALTGTASGNLVSGGALGTPSSGTGTNITGIPAANILAGTLATGTYLLSENASIGLDPAGSADGKYTGITVTGTGGATIAFGDLITLDKDDSRWELVDITVAAAATGDARGIMGMAVTSSTDGTPVTVLLQGIIRADANFPALTIGAAVYASTTGDIVVAQPSTTDYVIRIVGSALTADEIYFNPDNSWITHT